jgi:hypothetical protein
MIIVAGTESKILMGSGQGLKKFVNRNQ